MARLSKKKKNSNRKSQEIKNASLVRTLSKEAKDDRPRGNFSRPTRYGRKERDHIKTTAKEREEVVEGEDAESQKV